MRIYDMDDRNTRRRNAELPITHFSSANWIMYLPLLGLETGEHPPLDYNSASQKI